MNEPEKNTKPLDMTSDEAINFLFPEEAIQEMKKVANPDKQRDLSDLEDSDKRPYTEVSK